jgi:hypothetical protein
MGAACSTHGRDQKYIILVRKPEAVNYLGDLDTDESIVLIWILKKQFVNTLDSSVSGHGPVTGSCEHGNEPSYSI